MYLSVLLDLIVVFIFVFCIWHFKKKGFIDSSYKIASIILTIVLMLLFQDGISQYIKQSEFGNNIKQTVSESIAKKLESEEDNTSNEVEDNIDEGRGFFAMLGLPSLYTDIIEDGKEEIETAKQDLIEKAAYSITDSLINVLSVLLLYIIIRIALFFVFKLLGAVFKLPALKTLNGLLGAVCGALNALFIVYILCAVLVFFVAEENSKELFDVVDNSVVTDYFYENNLILEMFASPDSSVGEI